MLPHLLGSLSVSPGLFLGLRMETIIFLYLFSYPLALGIGPAQGLANFFCERLRNKCLGFAGCVVSVAVTQLYYCSR